MQVRIPKLVESQVGSVERIVKTVNKASNCSVPTTEDAKTTAVKRERIMGEDLNGRNRCLHLAEGL